MRWKRSVPVLLLFFWCAAVQGQPAALGDAVSGTAVSGTTVSGGAASGAAASGVRGSGSIGHSFTLGDSTFLLDGKPFQMISGEMHYTRVPREAWRDRMRMARAMGLNTIGTYVFWNVHEPQPGQFDFSGNNDIAEYVRIAREEGLWVVLRPSPYVCAEWEFGGYPYWLQNRKGLVVRSRETAYLAEYKKYIMAVGRQLAPLQVNHGGNILMVQLENEYGSYGSDKEYLEINRQLFREAGFDGLLYTCDPAADVDRGHLPGLLPAVNGIDNPARVERLVRDNHHGKGPFYVAEWYPAWFDWWGAPHHTVPAARYVSGLEAMLAAGISFNMYMFHGGTTRGFMNGANFKDSTPYEPQISSYDYVIAPLDEAGNATDKYMQFRAVIRRHLPPGVTLPDVPPEKPAMALAAIPMRLEAGLFHWLPAPVSHQTPLTFEALNQAYGFVLYRTILHKHASGLLMISGLKDYGIVFVDGRRTGVLDRRLGQDSLLIEAHAGARLDILVENLGRINFGKYLLQNNKGITGKVTLSGKELQGWNMYPQPFDRVPAVVPGREHAEDHRLSGPLAPAKTQDAAASLMPGEPAILKGSFELSTPQDTYLDMSDWGKGCAWVNGHPLGRYWRIGPQQTLYVPAEWLKKGVNEVTVFEELRPEQATLRTIDHPILDRLIK